MFVNASKGKDSTHSQTHLYDQGKVPQNRSQLHPFLEVFCCEQTKTGSAMHYVATTLIIQEMVENLHTTTAHTQ